MGIQFRFVSNNITVLVIAALTGLGFAFSQPAVAADKTTAFRISPLSEIGSHPLRQAPATVVSLNHTTLSAQLQANITTIPVGVSQQVKQGDLLLRLDCTDYDLALEMAQAGITIAQARLDLAKSQQKRSSQLLQKDLTSRENADTTDADATARQAELRQARIALQQAQRDISRCAIKAPFDGIITQRNASVGQLASIGTPLLTMVDTENLELSAQVKPAEVAQLQQAQLQFQTTQNYEVTLLRIGGTINSETRDQEIRLAFTAATPPPGSAGKLVWPDPRTFVAARFTVQREGRIGLYLKRQGKAEFHPLPNAIPGRDVLVDLPADTLIVTSHLGQLQPGDALP